MATEKKDKLTLKKYRKQADKLHEMILDVCDYYMESDVTASEFIGMLEGVKFHIISDAQERAKAAHMAEMMADLFGGDEDAD